MPPTERTLVLVKPDGVQRQLVGRILARYEERGLKVVGLKLVRVEPPSPRPHYAAHREKPFFAGLVEFITSAPLVAAALEGPNAIAVVRAINGATRPHEAAPGTIRGDFALETAQNIVHASDGPEAADDRTRSVVHARRAARLRPRHRPLGARPGRRQDGTPSRATQPPLLGRRTRLATTVRRGPRRPAAPSRSGTIARTSHRAPARTISLGPSDPAPDRRLPPVHRVRRSRR